MHEQKHTLRFVSPRVLSGTVPPQRKPNSEPRTREYLTEAEVERLMKAAKANRHGQRDATMVLLAFRHGLRAAALAPVDVDAQIIGQANSGQAARSVAPSNGAAGLTGKERLGEKWKDEQCIDNCKVPIDKRGTKARPDSCDHPPKD